MSKAENCPKGCKHSTFHYCYTADTHCDKHCICDCRSCLLDRANPGSNDPKMGGRILPGATVALSTKKLKPRAKSSSRSTARKKKSGRSQAINWRSCECGCHGETADVGHLHYWAFNAYERGVYVLKLGHGIRGDLLGEYPPGKLDDAVREHARPRLKERRKELRRAESIVD